MTLIGDEEWHPLRGVSCSGWDVQLMFRSQNNDGMRFATCYRRLEMHDEPLTIGRYHATMTEGEDFHKEVHRAFDRAEFTVEMVADPTIHNPLFGSF